jgi:hypothetical protein
LDEEDVEGRWKMEENGRSDKRERGMAVAFVDDSQVGELLDAGGWNDWQMVMVCMQNHDLVQMGIERHREVTDVKGRWGGSKTQLRVKAHYVQEAASA